MEVSAVLVVNDHTSNSGAIGKTPQRQNARSAIACAEIFGQSVLERTVARLRESGIRSISIIGGMNVPSFPHDRGVRVIRCVNPFLRWAKAQQILREEGSRIETSLMIGMSAYCEFDLADALKFYRAQGSPLTQLEDGSGPLDFWIVDSEWFRSAAAECTLPFRYGEFPGLPIPFQVRCYVRRLAEASDLRTLVVDAFLGRSEIRPAGKEIRPGVWLDVDPGYPARSELGAE